MTANQVDVACMGILVADFFSSPIPTIPKPGELMLVDSITLNTGGCAANTAVALTKLGVKAGVIGKVGSDPFGKFIIEDLSKKGIETSQITESFSEETSKTIIIPTKQEDRRYLHLFGANEDFSIDDINPDYLSNVKCIYVGGYLGMPKLDSDSLLSIFKRAKARNVLTVLDVIVASPESIAGTDTGSAAGTTTASAAADAAGSEDYLKQFEKVLPHVDAFIPNNDEAYIITGETEPERQAELLLGLGVKNVVITLGFEGSLLRTKNLLIKSKCYGVDFVDASGAGDAFDAGFIAALLEGEQLDMALKWASAMGASCVKKLGCSDGLFSKDELKTYIENNELEMEVKTYD